VEDDRLTVRVRGWNMAPRLGGLADLPVRAVFDGELVAFGGDGKPDFVAMIGCAISRRIAAPRSESVDQSVSLVAVGVETDELRAWPFVGAVAELPAAAAELGSRPERLLARARSLASSGPRGLGSQPASTSFVTSSNGPDPRFHRGLHRMHISGTNGTPDPLNHAVFA
jgi:hypothetical protein